MNAATERELYDAALRERRAIQWWLRMRAKGASDPALGDVLRAVALAIGKGEHNASPDGANALELLERRIVRLTHTHHAKCCEFRFTECTELAEALEAYEHE